jgi:primosomal protein N' (replication factor Y)
MAVGGLKLKREVAQLPAVAPIGEFTVAQVWVDASVYHLDSPFSYLIPGNLAEQVRLGSMVSVPFHGRDVLAMVIELSANVSTTGLKSINKVIGLPLLAPEILALTLEACKRYAAHPFDILRSALPDRVASVDKEFEVVPSHSETSTSQGKRFYLQMPPAKNRNTLLAQKVMSLSSDGSVLVVLPNFRQVSELSRELDALNLNHVLLDSKLNKSDFYRNFLFALTGKTTIVIGTRSSIFTPLFNLRNIVIYDEGSEHFYERRAPGWNVRDIALMRSHHQGINLTFSGYSPSAEISRLIDEDWIDYKKVRSKTSVLVAQQVSGELLPSRALAPLKKALSAGPVLFIVPLKGYAQAIRCAQCRTISRCECGGAHEKITLAASISCSHCLTKVSQWRCAWCHSERPYMQSRGTERHHQELGKLFPGTSIHISTADHFIEDTVDSGIVIATPGMAPRTSHGYSSVVVLEGNRFLNQPDLRATERTREMYFAHAALARENAPIILVQDDGHSIATSLTTWNPLPAITRELEERQQLGLPPYVRAAMLTMENAEIIRFKSALLAAQEDGRIPASTKILGPIPSSDKSSLILTVDVAHGDELVSTLHEFMRRRSAAKKSLPSLRIDPYSLSR